MSFAQYQISSSSRATANELASQQQKVDKKGSLYQTPVQCKLSIGAPDDPLEKEADDMADKVMRMEMPQPISFSSTKNSVNRKCDHCEEEEKEKLQRKKSSSDSVSVAPPIVHDVINSSGGRSMDTDTRSFMETRFNYDFSSVKIHDGDLAAKSASSINALAYTSGNNIVFNTGQYKTNTDSGKRLLAHELTHVVQQTANTNIALFKNESSGNSLIQRRSPSHRSSRGSHSTTTTPTLGSCRPVQDDVRPVASWANLQTDYQRHCSSVTSDVMGQVGHSINDIVHGRRPPMPHIPDARSTVDCACAHGEPRTVALLAMAPVLAAGPLAARLYWHFLSAEGTIMTIDVADMINRSTGVRSKIRRSIGHRGVSGTTRLEQHDYGDRELQFAYGAIDCVQWRVLSPAGRNWRSNPTTRIEVSMLDYYEFHPHRPGVSQCAHAASVELVARHEARNFWTQGSAVVTWAQLQH